MWPCLLLFFQVTLNVILNMAGVIFAITAITLYVIDLTGLWFRWMCSNDRYDYTDVTLSPESMEKCLEGKHLVVVSKFLFFFFIIIQPGLNCLGFRVVF